MRNIETRIHHYSSYDPSKPCDLVWIIEWRKNSRRQWREYARAYTPEDAENLRWICRQNNGRYPVVYETNNGLWKYKVTHDYSLGEGSFNVYFKRPFERWCFHHHKYQFVEAVKNCNELCRKKMPKDSCVTGILKYPHKLYKVLDSCVLCIRFPFLYPRNRWTGKHYSNYNLDKKIETLFDESHECTNEVKFHKGMSEEELRDMQHPKYRTTDRCKAIRCRSLELWRWILEVVHCVPTFTELDAMDHGWRKTFGIDMCKEIKKALKKEHYLRKYRITQIKEKWGELCWYDSGAPKEVFDIIRKYENISYRTCIACGKQAKYRTVRGWILPYCENCISSDDLDDHNYSEIKPNETGWEEINIEQH